MFFPDLIRAFIIVRVLGLSLEPQDREQEGLQQFIEQLSAWDYGLGATVFLLVCGLFAPLVYSLFHDFLPRGGFRKPTNSISQSITCLAMLVCLSWLAGWFLSQVGMDSILPRMAATLLIGLLCILFLWRASPTRRGESPSGLWDLGGIGREKAVRLLLVLPLALLAFLPINYAVAWGWNLILLLSGQPIEAQEVLVAPLKEGGLTVPVFFFLAVIVVPPIEEVVFRGALYRSLRQETGFIPAAVVSGLVFAVFHGHLPSLLPLFALSILLSFAYEWTGSLWACIILHGLFNCLNFVIA